MKRFTLIALAVFLLLIYSCKKDKQENQKEETYFTADKDNVNWGSKPGTFAELAAKDYYMTGHKGEERLVINMSTNSLNQYVLVNAKTEYYITIGRDAVVASYTPDETANNTIKVTNYDMKKVIMTGEFDIRFKKVTGGDSYPATVAFTNGKFKLATATD